MFGAAQIILLACRWIIQRLIGQQNSAHALMRIRPFIHIRVILERKFLESGFDGTGWCIHINAQYGIIISKRVHEGKSALFQKKRVYAINEQGIEKVVRTHAENE